MVYFREYDNLVTRAQKEKQNKTEQTNKQTKTIQ